MEVTCQRYQNLPCHCTDSFKIRHELKFENLWTIFKRSEIAVHLEKYQNDGVCDNVASSIASGERLYKEIVAKSETLFFRI